MIHRIARLSLKSCDTLSLFFFGDKQAGVPGYCDEAWQEFKAEFKRTPNAYAIGLGDYLDWLRPSMRLEVKRALIKDTSAWKQLDKQVMLTHDKMIDEMEFLKGKLLLLHEGHHNWEFVTGDNTDQRLAVALKAPYGGWIASTRLVIERANSNGHHVYTIMSTHGNANARRVPATVTWMERNLVDSWDADQYVMGHGCKNANFEPLERNRIRRAGEPGYSTTIPRCLIVGGFTKSYTNGWESSYVEHAGFAPQPIGWGVVRLKLVHRKSQALAKGVPNARHAWGLDVEQVNRNPLTADPS